MLNGDVNKIDVNLLKTLIILSNLHITNFNNSMYPEYFKIDY